MPSNILEISTEIYCYGFYALTQAGLVDICQQISALKHPWWKKVSCLPIGAVQSLKAFELKLDQSDVWSEYVSRTLLAADIARGLSYNMGRCGVVVANVALLNTKHNNLRLAGFKSSRKCHELQESFRKQGFPRFQCQVRRYYQGQPNPGPNGYFRLRLEYYKMTFAQTVKAKVQWDMQMALNKGSDHCKYNLY
ncbi:hypothetical protein CRM22_003298 [Opisthorchis felineus]|uniref:Uncharacterized protein n=1 Tax=Opisthorchis felineus TaxID=147828 RepID=A0A4S2M229_OPIFE|nr:hypothetical protein CRM22_003298 [Opisthorchis felineus]